MLWESDSKNIIVNLLRSKIVDPRSRCETSDSSNTMTGDGSTNSYDLTFTGGNKGYSITSVTGNAVELKAFVDYTFDLQNQTITINTTLGVVYVVTCKVGKTNWIFPDLNRKKITSITDYPRLNVKIVSTNGIREGNYTSNVYKTTSYMIHVWIKEKYKKSVDGIVYSGDALADYLSKKVVSVFEDDINELYPRLGNFELNNVIEAVWIPESQLWHSVIDISLDNVKESDTF